MFFFSLKKKEYFVLLYIGIYFLDFSFAYDFCWALITTFRRAPVFCKLKTLNKNLHPSTLDIHRASLWNLDEDCSCL